MSGVESTVVARIRAEPIRLDRLALESTDRLDGAVVLFVGRVRVRNDGRTVVGMEYDGYPELAERVLREIGEEAAERFEANFIEAVHRIGELGVGEISVAITIRSEHRANAYEASRYVIEQIKQRLPVWKRERYEDGAWRWLDGVPLVQALRGKGTS